MKREIPNEPPQLVPGKSLAEIGNSSWHWAWGIAGGMFFVFLQGFFHARWLTVIGYIGLGVFTFSGLMFSLSKFIPRIRRFRQENGAGYTTVPPPPGGSTKYWVLDYKTGEVILRPDQESPMLNSLTDWRTGKRPSPGRAQRSTKRDSEPEE